MRLETSLERCTVPEPKASQGIRLPSLRVRRKGLGGVGVDDMIGLKCELERCLDEYERRGEANG